MNTDTLLLFLDCDGVLNDHTPTPSRHCGILPHCRNHLNRITDETRAYLVISSAWRYLIHNGSMSVRGFENLLRTHGIKGRVVGYTRRDTTICTIDGEKPLENERGQQITDWLNEDGVHLRPYRYVVIDDLDLGISAAGHPFVQTIGRVGLTEVDTDRAIAMLKGEEE